MKKISILILFISLFTGGVNASSGYTTYTLDVKEFDQLKVVDDINVEYFCNPEKAGTVAFEATPELASAIMFDPNGKGRLQIQLASRETEYKNLPTVRVYSSYLSKVENDGDSTVTVVNLKEVPSLDVKLVGNGKLIVRGAKCARLNASLATGNGKIIIDGAADYAKLSLTGTGDIDAIDLLTKECNSRIVGTGWIKCWAVNALTVNGMGTGTVSYKGTPQIRLKALNIKVQKFE